MVQHLQNCKGKQFDLRAATPPSSWPGSMPRRSSRWCSTWWSMPWTAWTTGGTLTITLSQRDRMAEMEFADTGCGMTPEILENIFEPFFTRSRTGKGTGLGLSISHRIINQHGGEIEAASPGPNQGSTFTVRLPLQPAEPVQGGIAWQRRCITVCASCSPTTRSRSRSSCAPNCRGWGTRSPSAPTAGPPSRPWKRAPSTRPSSICACRA